MGKNLFRNKFRYLLRTIFFDIAEHVANSKLVDINRNELYIKNVSLNDINNIINICIPHNSVNPKASNNFINYLNISQKTYDLFWNKMVDLKNEFEISLQLLQFNDPLYAYYKNNIVFFDKIIKIKTNFYISNHSLEQNIVGWSATCQKQ